MKYKDTKQSPSDLSIYQSLLSSFSAEVHTAKASYFHNKINSTSDTCKLFKTFNSLLCPIKFSQESWCNFRWPTDFQRPQCKNCSILQVCTTQHQKDQALLYTACCTTSCPGPCYLWTRLLQCSSSWTSIMHNQTFTNDSECSGTTGLLRTQKSPCYTSLYLPALATGCSSHQVQDTDACI